ncbi:winged helix-turn-helix transcriptional regulator [Methanorbis rubei]|uniref:Winged helix-turn-helix transcriptional regulator n=1 Tax=Methanorbis rubei TaxID=3028300 RepID=A0AAE4MFH7_9EURY|nr:hypothetical protein [Methanocorpusculaceae archaeon Cs1]
MMSIDSAATGEMARVAACIRENPGISSDAIAQKTGIPQFWTDHAVRKLKRRSLILVIMRDGVSTYWVRREPKCAEEKILQEIMGRDVLHRIFSEIFERPGASAEEIAKRTGLSGVRVGWHLSRLEMFGAVVGEEVLGLKKYRTADMFREAYEIYQ